MTLSRLAVNTRNYVWVEPGDYVARETVEEIEILLEVVRPGRFPRLTYGVYARARRGLLVLGMLDGWIVALGKFVRRGMLISGTGGGRRKKMSTPSASRARHYVIHYHRLCGVRQSAERQYHPMYSAVNRGNSRARLSLAGLHI